MNIKFQPQDEKHPADKAIRTNVGEFRPGQSLSMQPWQEKEARRLIDNGDFVEVFDAPAPEDKAKAAPEVEEGEESREEQIAKPVRKRSGK